MRLSVNPNRMELLRLRRRLVLAERGHKLLKDKLEEIMRRFLQLMRRLFELQEGISPKLKKAFLSFVFVRARSSHRELEKLIPEGRLLLAPKRERIFNVSIPKFEVEEKEISDYDFVNTESELDIGIKKIQAHEIEVTRRRVNALEHILIPNIKKTVSYISSRLEEMERSYQVQLMRVKEIVRKH
jgi:V/A-type H+-transporting ATPase subunit D